MVQQIKNNTDALITPKQMAVELGVKPSWLYRQTMSHGEGSIPRIKLGKYLRFNRDEVFNWIRSKQK